MSSVHVLHDIATKPESWKFILQNLTEIKQLHAYKEFILYTARTLHTFTREQKRNIHTFLVHQDIITGSYRITKYDTAHMFSTSYKDDDRSDELFETNTTLLLVALSY